MKRECVVLCEPSIHLRRHISIYIYIYIGTAKVASTVCYRRQRRGLPLTLHIHMPSCRTDMASPHRNPLLICVYMFGVPFLSDSLAFLFFYVYLRTHKMRIYMDINTAYAFLFPCRHAHISASRFQGLTFADVRLFGCQSLCLLMCECVHSYESKSTIKLKIKHRSRFVFFFFLFRLIVRNTRFRIWIDSGFRIRIYHLYECMRRAKLCKGSSKHAGRRAFRDGREGSQTTSILVVHIFTDGTGEGCISLSISMDLTITLEHVTENRNSQKTDRQTTAMHLLLFYSPGTSWLSRRI